jgi:hypothetical protein
MLDVPPFTPAEGAELLAPRPAATGCPRTSDSELVAGVDGHALAVAAWAPCSPTVHPPPTWPGSRPS